MNAPLTGRALVIGGSIAGTLAARVLTETHREVVVVDRDEVAGVSTARRGASHAHHAHGLHARGYAILSELFPGLLDELGAMGVPIGDLAEMRWYVDAKPMRPTRSGVPSITALRPLLEHHLRTRVAALPGVRYRDRTDVLGLLSTPGGERVTGVRLRSRRPGAPEERMTADLVVDASGRGSRTPVWLNELGYDRPVEERMTIGLTYTTRRFRTRPGMFPGGVQSINPLATPAHPRGAFFGQVAPDECILSLTGMLGDRAPTDPQGFLAYAGTLAVPEIHEAVRDAQPLTDPVAFRFPASVRRRYERLRRFPDALVVLGDAVCSFNPVYGQGMTVAAIEALALRDHLRRPGGLDPRRLRRAIGRIVDTPWQVSTSGDLAFPGVVGPRPLPVRLGNAYMAKVQHAATLDPEVTAAFMRVAGLIDAPTALMRPRMLLRVLRLARRTAAVPTAARASRDRAPLADTA